MDVIVVVAGKTLTRLEGLGSKIPKGTISVKMRGQDVSHCELPSAHLSIREESRSLSERDDPFGQFQLLILETRKL